MAESYFPAGGHARTSAMGLLMIQDQAVEAIGWWSDLNPWIKTAVVLVGAVVLYAVLRRAIIGPLERMAQKTDNDLDDRLLNFARHFAGIILVFVVLVIILNLHGVEITPLLAGAGIFGVALGFAAKESIADILAGIFLVLDRPMRRGDRVKLEHIGREWGGWGDVVDIGIRRTTVRNTDGVVVNYPNALLATSVITNFSHEREPIRVRVRFQVDYEADLDRVREVAMEAIEKSEGVIQATAEIVTRAIWDDSRGHMVAGVLVEGRYKIYDVSERTRIRSRVLENLLKGLRAANVPLPAPRVHIENS